MLGQPYRLLQFSRLLKFSLATLSLTALWGSSSLVVMTAAAMAAPQAFGQVQLSPPPVGAPGNREAGAAR